MQDKGGNCLLEILYNSRNFFVPEAEWIRGANLMANSGLGEFIYGVILNNFIHKLLVKLFIIPLYIISLSYNLVTAILPSEIRNL
jgi:hypothetical protein